MFKIRNTYEKLHRKWRLRLGRLCIRDDNNFWITNKSIDPAKILRSASKHVALFYCLQVFIRESKNRSIDWELKEEALKGLHNKISLLNQLQTNAKYKKSDTSTVIKQHSVVTPKPQNAWLNGLEN